MNIKRLVVSLVLALALAVVPATAAIAATSDTVTVTAVPSYVGISNAPNTWTINGITGSGVIATSTTYYSNPLGDTTAPAATVADADCRFTVTNSSTIPITLTVNFGNFSGGNAMTNSDLGTAGATTFGAYAWASGVTYATGKVIAKTAASSAMKTSLAALTNIKWGLTISTSTDAWTTRAT